jgi:hypothetical protein
LACRSCRCAMWRVSGALMSGVMPVCLLVRCDWASGVGLSAVSLCGAVGGRCPRGGIVLVGLLAVTPRVAMSERCACVRRRARPFAGRAFMGGGSNPRRAGRPPWVVLCPSAGRPCCRVMRRVSREFALGFVPVGLASGFVPFGLSAVWRVAWRRVRRPVVCAATRCGWRSVPCLSACRPWRCSG